MDFYEIILSVVLWLIFFWFVGKLFIKNKS